MPPRNTPKPAAKQARRRSRSASRPRVRNPPRRPKVVVEVNEGRMRKPKPRARPMLVTPRMELERKIKGKTKYRQTMVRTGSKLTREQLQFLLPLESPSGIIVPDHRLAGQDVIPCKTFYNSDLDVAQLLLYNTSFQPQVKAITGGNTNPLWRDVNQNYYVVHVGDTRLSMIMPWPASRDSNLGSGIRYACELFANNTSITISGPYNGPPLTVINTRAVGHFGVLRSGPTFTYSTSLTARLLALERKINGSTDFIDVPDVASQAVWFQMSTESTLANYISFTDFLPSTADPSSFEKPYGDLHPPVFFKYNGADLAAIWVDACPDGPVDISVAFKITTPEVPFNGTFVLGGSDGPSASVTDGFCLQAFFVDVAESGTVLTLADNSYTFPNTEYPCTDGTTGILIETVNSFTSSGYLAFKFKGTITAIVPGTDPTKLPLALAINMTRVQIYTRTNYVSRHVVNPHVVPAPLSVAGGNGQSQSLLQDSLLSGSSVLLSNATPEQYLGGTFRGYRFTADTLWWQKTCLTNFNNAIGTGPSRNHDYQTHGFKDGAYSVYKPKDIPMSQQLGCAFTDVLSFTLNVQLKCYLTQPTQTAAISVNPYNLLVISPPLPQSGSTTFVQKVLVTNAQNFQFTTTSQLFNPRRLPTSGMEERLVRALTTHPTFAENPFHFLSMIKDFIGGVKQGIGAVANVVSQIAPVAASVGNALGSVPDPRISGAGSMLAQGANVASQLASAFR